MSHSFLRVVYLSHVYYKEYKSSQITNDETEQLLKEMIIEQFNHLKNTNNIVIILDDLDPIFIYGFNSSNYDNSIDLIDPHCSIKLFNPLIFDRNSSYFIPTEINYDVSHLSLIITSYHHIYCLCDSNERCIKRYFEIIEDDSFEDVNVYLCIMHLINISREMTDEYIEKQLCKKILKSLSYNDKLIDTIAKKYPIIKLYFES